MRIQMACKALQVLCLHTSTKAARSIASRLYGKEVTIDAAMLKIIKHCLLSHDRYLLRAGVVWLFIRSDICYPPVI